MVLKAVFFPHAEFDDACDLRNWLGSELKVSRRGVYHLHNPSGLGKLEEGSLVFFRKSGFVVGTAIVEEKMRKTTKDERSSDRKMYGKVYENVIKFAPDSIWPWNDDQFLTYDEVSAIINKLIKGRIYSKVDTLDQLLRLFQAVTKH